MLAMSDILDDLRAQFAACELIAFADMTAQMVLMKSAQTRMPQERWDGLCAMAKDVLRGPAADHALDCLDAPKQATLSRAAVLNAKECDIFLTTAAAPDFVLCAVGGAGFSVTRFLAAAQPVLDQLVQDD